ncbi:MAG: 16S rRNA (uracil(1498)-N(3))-methyltransferase [Candidatus Coatesbacteria bacterium]|nr:16S rRNA (uracil(1498)-N(3))-methyltransferase [Candidatus Coatesbacteria bacterium]
MHRIYLPKKAIADGRAAIVGAQAHKVTHVLRLTPGDELLASDGRGTDFVLRIERIGPDLVSCKILATKEPQSAETRNQIVLMQCCLSSAKMDQVIDRTTQLGASRFVPVASEKSKFRGEGSRIKSKVERWYRIAQAAALQSGRAVFPIVEPITPLRKALDLPSHADRRLLFSPYADAESACDVLPKLLSDLNQGEAVYLLLGPEAGFSEAENRAAVRCRFTPVRTGLRTLRAETAPIVALTLVLYHLEEL